MGQTLTNWVVDSILKEDIKKEVVVYAGRFQPFHFGHAEVYKHLVGKFGKNNVFIGTSNKQGGPRHPFNFKEKKEVMTKMFKIPSNKIVQIKNPYAPSEIIGKFPEKTTAFITVVGKKDADRLTSPGYQKYFSPYKKNDIDTGYKDKGYVYVSPSFGNISGTAVRDGMSKGDESKRKAFFKKVYGKFDPKIFNLISGRLSKLESVMESFFQSINFTSLIEGSLYGADAGEPDTIYVPAGKTRVLGTQKSSQKDEPWMDSMGYTQMHFPIADSIYSKNSKGTSDEAEYYAIKKIKKNPALKEPVPTDDFVTSGIGEKGQELHKIDEASFLNLGKGVVDDGPGAFYGDMRTYKSEMEEVIGTLGWDIIDYLMDEDTMESFTDTEYPMGPGRYPVSFFPSGKDGLDALSHRYGDALQGTDGYKKWANHIKGVALQLGYEFLNFLEPGKPMSGTRDQENVLSDEPKKEEETTTLKEDLKRFESKLLSEGMIMEGGAYGHMNHPFDTEMNLTFGDLKIIISKALEGTLEFTREKTDGQALAISYRKDKGIIAARNKGHLKDRGLNALDIKGVSDKFANRGGLTDAYNFAMRDLESAISKLSNAQRSKIFKDGSKFMNLEVIWPESVNVIPYGQPLLVFHGTMEYDESGKAIGADTSDAKILAGMIKQVNADVQKNYTIQGPPIVKVPRSQDLSNKKSIYSSKVNKLQKQFKLKDSNGVADYHQAWWSDFIDKNSPSALDNKTKMGLVKRWAFYDKSFRLNNKFIKDKKTLEWANKTDKQDHSKMAKNNMRPFEDIFLGLGAEVLSFMSSALTVNPDKALRDIQKQLDKTIVDVRKSGDPKKIAKLKMELERLNSIGGRNKIVPNEGIVFTYKGGTYKLTGTFAPLNQILGLFY
tara:strand:+ start:1446 stop:4109 length:2664 start_codon:yes stop_codon:yes gene_type:complete